MVLDPMLGAGGSAVACINTLKQHGCRTIRVMAIISAPEGIKKVQDAHPDVEIFTAAVDDYLNDHGYIVPGLGGAGGRLFGAKGPRKTAGCACPHGRAGVSPLFRSRVSRG